MITLHTKSVTIMGIRNPLFVHNMIISLVSGLIPNSASSFMHALHSPYHINIFILHHHPYFKFAEKRTWKPIAKIPCFLHVSTLHPNLCPRYWSYLSAGDQCQLNLVGSYTFTIAPIILYANSFNGVRRATEWYIFRIEC